MPESYDSIRDRGFAALRAGDVPVARALIERAAEIAEQSGAEEVILAARANRSMILLQSGETDSAEQGLREILLRSSNPAIRAGAATTLTLVLKGRNQREKAQFYAQTALDASRESEDPVRIASSFNLLGILAMGKSYLHRAERCFQTALSIRENRIAEAEDPDQYYRVYYLDNLGYARILRENSAGALPLLYQAYSIALNHGIRRHVSECAQDLCFGLLKTRQLEESAVWGTRALETAEEHGYEDIRRNCFYLLGEVYSLLGQDGDAEEFFDRLQAHYPNLPFLRDFLRAFDITGMITLKEF